MAAFRIDSRRGRSMPPALGAFLEAAALAASLGAAFRVLAPIVGGDARGLRASALGVLAALAVAGPVARRLPWRLLAAASAVVIAGLAALGPAAFAGRVPPGTGGLALVAALVFLFPVARAAVAAASLAAFLPVALAGAAAGLVAGHLLLAPLVGERIAAIGLGVALALVRVPGAASPAPRVLLALAWGAVLGALVDVARLFLFQYLSGTRFSWTVSGGLLLAGLALGASLAKLVAPGRARAAGEWIALALGPPTLFFALAGLARARFPEPMHEALVSGGALVEIALVITALGLPSLLLGAAIGGAGRSSRGVAAAAVGLVAGLHAGVLALPPSIEEAFVRRRGRDMVVEHAIAGDGVFERIRSFSRPGSAVAHWNRDAVSRSAGWNGLARAEVFAAQALAPSPMDTSLLVVGSPSAAHAAAIAEAGFGSAERIDLLPDAAPDAPPRHAIDVFRQAGAGGERRASVVVVLSKPFLSAGDGALLTREGFAVLRALAAESSGEVLVWLDPGALPPGSARAVVSAFFAEFPGGSFVPAQDGVFGPLLGLASAPLPRALASGKSLMESFGPSVRISRLETPALEARLPLAARRSEHAPAGALEEWAGIVAPFAPDVAALFAALGPVAAADGGARNPFEDAIEAVPLPASTLEALTAALERFPGSVAVRGAVAAAGRLLLARREPDEILRLGPRWIAARPEDAEILYIVGRQHTDLLDPRSARPLLERAAALDPESAEIRSTLEEVRAAEKSR